MLQVMYQLRPCQAWRSFRDSNLPTQKLDALGNAMVEQWPRAGQNPRPLLDFPVLPDQVNNLLLGCATFLSSVRQIGTKEHWTIIEAWRRLDPRIRHQDIVMRQMPDNGNRSRTAFQEAHALQQSAGRERAAFAILSWFARNHNTKIENTILARLTPAQVAANTTRGTTPGPVDPSLPDGPHNRILLPPNPSITSQRLTAAAPARAAPANAGPQATNQVPTAAVPSQSNGSNTQASGSSSSSDAVDNSNFGNQSGRIWKEVTDAELLGEDTEDEGRDEWYAETPSAAYHTSEDEDVEMGDAEPGESEGDGTQDGGTEGSTTMAMQHAPVLPRPNSALFAWRQRPSTLYVIRDGFPRML